MNTQNKSILFGLSLLIAFPAFAHEEDARSTLKSEGRVPVATKIVRPGVEPHQVGKVVLVRFTITDEGNPTRIRTADFRPEDPDLAARVIHALRSWKFSPAQDKNGQPIATSVTMPIKIDRIARN